MLIGVDSSSDSVMSTSGWEGVECSPGDSPSFSSVSPQRENLHHSNSIVKRFQTDQMRDTIPPAALIKDKLYPILKQELNNNKTHTEQR